MTAFKQARFELAGVEVAVSELGDGPPLLFLHGAGTVTGFDALLPLADHFRLIVPNHPGFGDSSDDPQIRSVHDYERIYLDLLDKLGIDELTLAGHSMGGWIAATLAISQRARLHSLVLAAPWGLRVVEHPTVDIFSLPDAEVPEYLAADLSVFAGKVPDPPTPDWLADRYRESTSAARLMWAHTYDQSLARWLHRIEVPTLLLWGESDRVVPVGQLGSWQSHINGANACTLPGVGHLLFDESVEAVEAIGEFALRYAGG